jgi:hypothetical protein
LNRETVLHDGPKAGMRALYRPAWSDYSLPQTHALLELEGS